MSIKAGSRVRLVGLAGPQAWLAGSQGWLGLGPGWLGLRSGWMAMRGDKQLENFQFYRTSCPLRAAAEILIVRQLLGTNLLPRAMVTIFIGLPNIDIFIEHKDTKK